MGEAIAILSGKGGTGKTSVCAAIATALARDGKRVLCIDCDVGLRNLDIPLGLAHTASLSFLDICQGRYTIDQIQPHPLFPTLSFLTAPVNCSADDIDAEAFSELVSAAREKFDYIFLDAPAGLDAGFRLAANLANRILLVTGSDPASVRDAGRTGQKLELMGKTNVRLIINRVRTKLISNMALTLDDIMDDAGLPLLGVVPEDANVVLAAANSRPLITYTKKGAAAACTRIAQRIQGRPVRIRLR